MAKRNRFKVIEYSGGYELLDTKTGQSHWLSDGVDSLFTSTGKSMIPGTEYFRKTWERTFNWNIQETLEAYFNE